MRPDERRRFEHAILPHIDAAYNLARWLTQDEHCAEDVVQEAFVRAARYFESFQGEEGRPWILGVVRRASFDWLAKNRKRTMTQLDEDLHDHGDDSANPEYLLMRLADQAKVREALAELAPDLREVIVLRDMEGMSYAEIAQITEIPVGTVMSRLSRGRRKLQIRLARFQEGWASNEL